MTPERAVDASGGHRVIGMLAAPTAVSAYGGAAGLVSGFLATDATLDSRLPFASPVFGGTALAYIVAVPSTFLAARAHAPGSDSTARRRSSACC